MKKWLRITLIGFVFASLAQASERVIQEEFDLNAGGKFLLDIRGGNVNLHGNSGTKVIFTATISGSESFVTGFELNFDAKPDQIRITQPKKAVSFGFSMQKVELEITVPESTRLELITSGGDMKVDHITSEANLRTSGGNISLHSFYGNLDAKTSGGDIHLSDGKGSLVLKTSGGDIKVESWRGDVVGQTSGGDITLATAGKIDCATSGGSIKVNMAGENQGVTAKTSGGSIKLFMPPTAKATLIAKCSAGEVDCELPILVQGARKATKLEGTINGGGPEINLKTSAGNIKIMVSK